MPLYEYECEQCAARFEVIQRFSDPAVETCRACGGQVHKLISPPAIHFKGSGWYITDYAKKKNGGSPSTEGSSTPSSAETKSDSSSSSTPTSTSSSSSADSSKKD